MSYRMWRAGLIFHAALALAGCVPPTMIRDNVRVEDHDAPAYIGSMIVRPEEMRYGQSGKGGRGGVEFTYERFRGQFDQEVELSHFLQIGPQPIIGPQRVTNTADIQQGLIGYNHLFNFGKLFEFEPALGITYHKLSATSLGSLPTARLATIDANNWGVALRITPRLMLNRFIGLEGSFGAGVDMDGQWGSTRVGSIVLRPISNISLKGGYYAHDQRFDFSDGTSDVIADFSGFAASVTVAF